MSKRKKKEEEIEIVSGNRTQSPRQALGAFRDAEKKSMEAIKNNPAFRSLSHLKKINGVLDVIKKHSGKKDLIQDYDYYHNSRERGFSVIKTKFGFDMKTYNHKNMVKDLRAFGVEKVVGKPGLRFNAVNLKIDIPLKGVGDGR